MHFETRQLTDGDAILERLADASPPKELKNAIAAFKKVQGDLKARQKLVDAAREKRDAAHEAVTATDARLDQLIRRLGDLMPALGGTTRSSPFAGYSKRSPSDLTELPMALEADEATSMVAAIKKKKLHREIVKQCDAITVAAKALKDALKATNKPQAAYDKALASRDELLLEWTTQRARLQRRATGAWADSPSTVAAIFAPASALEAPTKKAPKKGDPAAPAAPTG